MTPLRDFLSGIRSAFSSSQVRFLLAMTAMMITIASLVYHWAEGWSLLDSIYFSVITIATIGYGDLVPQTALGKIFTIVYVLIGLGLFVGTATAIADRIINNPRRRDRSQNQE